MCTLCCMVSNIELASYISAGLLFQQLVTSGCGFHIRSYYWNSWNANILSSYILTWHFFYWKAALHLWNKRLLLFTFLLICFSFFHVQASLRKLISIGRNLESVEESISFMITQLINRMCTPFKGNGKSSSLVMILTVFLFLVIISDICFCVC